MTETLLGTCSCASWCNSQHDMGTWRSSKRYWRLGNRTSHWRARSSSVGIECEAFYAEQCIVEYSFSSWLYISTLPMWDMASRLRAFSSQAKLATKSFLMKTLCSTSLLRWSIEFEPSMIWCKLCRCLLASRRNVRNL